MNFEDIENAGFSSWPAEEQLDKEGMVLRFASGYTKRANSVTVMQPWQDNFSDRVNSCEAYYQAKGLPCIFRIPSLSHNESLDKYLQLNGYNKIDLSLILFRSLDNFTASTTPLKALNPEQWITSFCKLSEKYINRQQPHIDILKRITDKTLFAVLVEEGKEIACGAAIINNQYCGLFDVVTDKKLRHQGYGTKLLNGLLDWAVSNGATKSYIQVVADNQAAIKLYQKMGYQYAYEYHYRIKEF